MYSLFIVLLIVVGLVLIASVLLQAGQGGGLSAQFGGASSTDAFVGSRQATTILHKLSWWGGGTFLFLCFLLGLVSSRTNRPRSILEEQFRQQQEAPAPLQPLPLNQSTPPAGGAQTPAPQGNPPPQPAPPAR